MISNYQRALDLAYHIAEVDETPRELVKQLHQYGLLAPDLPEPSLSGTWEEGRAVVYIDTEGYIVPDIPARPHHPERVKRLALAFLAAAHHAEAQANE